MGIKSTIVLIIATTVIILSGSIYVMNATTQSAQQVKTSSLVKAYTVDPTSYDWGTINYSGHKATKSFIIKNTGKEALQLYNIRTSCHCTKAYLTIDGQSSPEFGMDMGGDASSYIGKVQPGKVAKLTVVFDQSFHGPSGIGPITRFVNVDTNDKSTPQLTFTLTGTVVNK